MQSLSEHLVVEFLDQYRHAGKYLRDNISQLVQLAISEDPEVSESATRALFAGLIERLADSFEPGAVTLYNRIFSQVIQICRRNPTAAPLDRELSRSGLDSEEDLIVRAEKFRTVERLNATNVAAPRRVIVLSRVTLGADVAVTSVILERVKQEFPGAEVVLLGGSKTAELFGGDPRLQIEPLGYGRAGTTISRLLSWTELLACLRELTRDLTTDEYLVIDPDSRLTQLGLLPVTPTRENARYLFFPSREYRSNETQPLGELTSLWLDEVFGEGARIYPTVSLRSEDLEAARTLAERIKSGRLLVSINFGVGENPLKRVGGDFEASLVAGLIKDGFSIVLDKGAGEEETHRADQVIREATRIERGGRRAQAVEVDERMLSELATSTDNDADLLVWNGRIGILAALIARSDLYVGYDSAGQHIAAALGVPCIDVFAGFGSRRFMERWRPAGKSETRVVAVDDGANASALLSSVLRAAGEMLRTRS